jgi:hypothetical protein
LFLQLSTMSEVRELVSAVGGARYTSGLISFGARQAIIVRNNESRRALPPEFANATVVTVAESKGLEFDDVILFNFWKDSPATTEWRLWLNYKDDELEPLQKGRAPGDDSVLPTNGPLRGFSGHPLRPASWRARPSTRSTSCSSPSSSSCTWP